MPHLRLHSHISARWLPTVTFVSASPFSSLRKEGIRSRPLAHATEIDCYMYAAGNHRSLDSILRCRLRLPHKISVSHTSIV
jgi:hypothetical protein